jgi:hypothetical protein
MIIRKVLVGACVAFALVCESAMALPYSATVMRPTPYPIVSNVAQCAAGFTAMPATINPAQPYNQSYVCTASAIVCSPSFKPVAVYLPAQAPGQLFGPLSPSSPLTLKNGRVVYTCEQPSTPPQ